MVDLVPDALPVEDVHGGPGHAEHVPEDGVPDTPLPPRPGPQQGVEDVQEETEQGAEEQGAAVAEGVVALEDDLVQQVVVDPPGASPEGHHQRAWDLLRSTTKIVLF